MPVHCGGDPRGPLLLLGILLAVSLFVVEYPAKCKMAYKKACLLVTWVCLFLTSLQVEKPVYYIILYSFQGGFVLYIVDCCIELMSQIVRVIFWLFWLGVCWGTTFISLRSFTLVLQMSLSGHHHHCCHQYTTTALYIMSFGVNWSSWSKLFLLQNWNDGTMLILFFLSPPFNAGPQKPQTLTA